MGFRGFKGSIGDKGYSITARDFNRCQSGWIQIPNTKFCLAVLNDVQMVNFGIASSTCFNQNVFGNSLGLATFSSTSDFEILADTVSSSSSTLGAIVIKSFPFKFFHSFIFIMLVLDRP